MPPAKRRSPSLSRGGRGRYCSREESSTLTVPLMLSVAAALVVQIGVMLFQLLLGTHMGASELIVSVLLPTLALTALLSPPVLLIGRRLLGPPRVVEPYALGSR